MPRKTSWSKRTLKEHYEIEKLKAEIAQIKRPFYKKTPFWNLLIALSTLFILYRNGAFDFKTKALELKRENLEYDVRQFTSEKVNLKSQIESFRMDLTNLTELKTKLQYANKISQNSLSEKDKYLGELLNENDQLKRENNDFKQQNPLSLSSLLQTYQPNIIGSGGIVQTSLNLGKSAISSSNFDSSFDTWLQSKNGSNHPTWINQNESNNSVLNTNNPSIGQNYLGLPTISAEKQSDGFIFTSNYQLDSNNFLKRINNN
jgi:hypothetical protein